MTDENEMMYWAMFYVAAYTTMSEHNWRLLREGREKEMIYDEAEKAADDADEMLDQMRARFRREGGLEAPLLVDSDALACGNNSRTRGGMGDGAPEVVSDVDFLDPLELRDPANKRGRKS